MGVSSEARPGELSVLISAEEGVIASHRFWLEEYGAGERSRSLRVDRVTG